jgi:hypothetical protein
LVVARATNQGKRFLRSYLPLRKQVTHPSTSIDRRGSKVKSRIR